MNSERLEIKFFSIVLIITLGLVSYILLPFISALVLGVTLAILFRPIYARLNRYAGESLSALLTILIVLIVIFVPLFFLGMQIFSQATELYSTLRVNAHGNVPSYLGTMLEKNLGQFGLDVRYDVIGDYIEQTLKWLLSNLGPIFTSIAQLSLTFFLGLLGLYYFLKDGARFRAQLIEILPLETRYAEKILDRLDRVIVSVIRGTLTVAVIQGIIAGIGFWIFGVPRPAFWGSIGIITALIPALGTSLVMVPAVVYLALTGNTASAIGLGIWGALAVGLIDNVLGPKLMQRGVEIHPLFILLSVLGGITLFGPVGFLLGPLSVAFLFALLDIYPQVILKKSA